ncbi:Dystroglycan-type cadherin-like protein [Macrophomina phaseolina MS6]|uniref:Dystroglycan-type cadherin-like protein n=1 Tax=Macrophomina phaseolina (strain MS6) TaxID=1126212 RepID=K2SAE3_MACPH|nr:Dystroglycan-type cadherin-like protein [Macrophomina phaseolina MS6]
MLCAMILLLAAATEAAPTLSFPFNSQVPPVARASQPFDFEFSPGTFTPVSGDLEYSLSGSPKWLSLDSPNRRLYGTPTDQDIGAPEFTIIAEDATGSTPMQATLIVSAHPAPKLNVDLTNLLSKAGRLSGPSSLSLLPSKQYSIQFPADTFTSTSTAVLTYYATLSDRSPLPSWVSFNADPMVFSGTTSASPQTVDLMLIASDVTGFAGAWVIFTLSVSAHQLVFTNVTQNVSISGGSVVSITSLRDQLSFDGKPLAESDFENATANQPDWLSFDSKTLDISGTAPPRVNATTFTVSVADRLGDVANTTVQLVRDIDLLRGEVGSLNAIIGESAKFDFSTVVVKQPGLQVHVDLGTAAQWLHFDESSLTVEGEIPASASPETIRCTIKVTAAGGAQTSSEPFDIVVKAATMTGSNGSTPRSASPTSNASATAESSVTGTAGPIEKKNSTKNGAIIAVSVVCVVVAVIALVLGYLLYRRSRRSGRSGSPKRKKEDISRPIYHDDDWQMTEDAFVGDRDVEKGQGTVRRTEELPPQISTPSPLKKAITERRGARGHKYKPSHTTSIGEGDREVLQSAIHSGDWSVAAGALQLIQYTFHWHAVEQLTFTNGISVPGTAPVS